MIVTLYTDQLTRLEQIEQFLDGTTNIEFRAPGGAARRAWIEQVVRRFGYAQRARRERGLLLRAISSKSPATRRHR
jgi:hypothetical protein